MTTSNSSATLLKTISSIASDPAFVAYCQKDIIATSMALSLEIVHTMDLGYAPEQEFCYWAMPLGYTKFDYAEMDRWITATIGEGGWGNPNSNWIGSSQRYWFKKESHRTLFVLKWTK